MLSLSKHWVGFFNGLLWAVPRTAYQLNSSAVALGTDRSLPMI